MLKSQAINAFSTNCIPKNGFPLICVWLHVKIEKISSGSLVREANITLNALIVARSLHKHNTRILIYVFQFFSNKLGLQW